MSKVRGDMSEDQMRNREESKQRKESENNRRREEYLENTKRAEENARRAEELACKLGKKKNQNSNSAYHIMFAVLGAVVLYVIVMMFMGQSPALHKVLVIDDKKIEEHNMNNYWKQGANDFFEASNLADAKKLMNVGFASHQNLGKCSSDDSITPPESFNYRESFSNCVLPTPNMGSGCGASYAFTVAQTVAERECIVNKKDKATPLSAQELVKCDILNSGCKNGHLNVSFDHVKSKGLVEETCLPYNPSAEKCEGMCENPQRTKIDSYCLLVGEDDIKRDIMKNGPVVSTSHIYVDFLAYKSGVYYKAEDTARFSGQTAVRIVGWGVESGMENEQTKGNKYWIIQHPWGKTWGDDGFAKVSMGQDLFFDQYAYSAKIKSDAPKKVKKEEPKVEEVKAEEPASVKLDDVAEEEVKTETA